MAEYIDRETAIKLLEEHDGNFSDVEGQWWSHGLNAAISHIRELPVAEVGPVVHGRWVAEENESVSKRSRLIKYRTYYCSICGASNGRREGNYCPNCGAKMDGGGEDV